ncbi:MAG: hypothetical protein Q4F05_07235 [bacterium]|nr:hypothetical protein [bacterium]
MKKYRIVTMIFLFIAGISCAVFFYQPLKENQVYEKELVLKEDNETKVSKWDEEKLILKAKDTFQTLLGLKIQESKYDAVVKFEIIALNAGDKEKREVARVSFLDKKYNATEYIVAYDTETGELVELYSVY